MKVFISTSTFAQLNQEALGILRKYRVGFLLNPLKRKLTEREISSFLQKEPFVGLIAGTEPITKDVLRKAKSLKVISRVGTGLDNIDLGEAKRLKVKIYNTPNVLVDSVAELTIGLILSALRKIPLMDRQMHDKAWNKEMGLLFKRKILGIIGFGRIGKRVAALAKAFGAEVIFCDLRTIKTKVARQVSFPKLVKYADIITIHSSAKGTLISRNEIKSMKEGVVLVNTSRGSAIDEEALYSGLKSGRIASVALDVFDQEPYAGKLLKQDNCILTPHVGSYSKEARIQMEIEAVNNLIQGLGLASKNKE